MLTMKEEFAAALFELRPEQLLGLAKFLGVRITTDEWDPETKIAKSRDAEEIYVDCFNRFNERNREDRRFILKELRKEIKNGVTTEHKEKK